MRFSFALLQLRKTCLLLLLTAVACTTACHSDSSTPAGTRTNFAPKPRAFGDVNRINVIADDDLLATHVGDSVRYYYEQAYPLMPQPEPLYDLQHLSVEDLNKLPARKELNNYLLLADLNEEDSPTTRMALRELGEEKIYAAREDYRRGTSIVTDRWATGQTLIYLIAEGPDELAMLVAQSFPAASKRIAAADRSKLEANTYQSGKATVLRDSMRDLVGLTLDVPLDYKPALMQENLVWLRRDLGQIIQNVIVSSVPYTGEEQLSQDSIVAYRNAIGKEVVRSTTPGSFMTSNDRDLPVVTSVIEINGNYAYEARGVWEMTKDFMGGPYFTYLIPDSASGKLYLIDVFAYAPSKRKRNYMQQLELIARSARIGQGAAAPAG